MEVSWYDLTQAAKRAANQFNDQHTQRQNYLHANPPKRPEASKASALGRRHMQELSRVVQQMSKAVDSGQLSEEELSRRRGDLEQSKMLLKEAQAASKVVPQDALRADLLSGSQMSRSARDPVDTAATRDLDEQQLMDQQRTVLALQDETLDDMERGVHHVHGIARTLHSEVHLQNALLDDFQGDTDIAGDRLAGVQARLAEVTARMNPRFLNICLFCTALLCSMFLVWCLHHL